VFLGKAISFIWQLSKNSVDVLFLQDYFTTKNFKPFFNKLGPTVKVTFLCLYDE